jgi:hypothetical protein
MAFKGERTPARPDRLDARGLSGPNRSGDSGAVYEPGRPENAPRRHCREHECPMPATGMQGRKPRKLTSQLGLQPRCVRRAPSVSGRRPRAAGRIRLLDSAPVRAGMSARPAPFPAPWRGCGRTERTPGRRSAYRTRTPNHRDNAGMPSRLTWSGLPLCGNAVSTLCPERPERPERPELVRFERRRRGNVE